MNGHLRGTFIRMVNEEEQSAASPLLRSFCDIDEAIDESDNFTRVRISSVLIVLLFL